MFTLLATTAAEGSKFKLVVALIISLLVAAGAGVRTFNSLKNKKFSLSSLDEIADSIYKDPELIGLLKSVITDKCFQDSNTYEEFISNVHNETTELLRLYLVKNISYVPEVLRPFVTAENLEEIAEDLLGLAGFDGKELTDMFEKYLEDLLTTEEDVEDEVKEELIEETVSDEVVEEVVSAEPVIETDEVVTETTPATVEVETVEEVPTADPVIEDAVEELKTEEVLPEGDLEQVDTIEGETPTLEVDETSENIEMEAEVTEEVTETTVEVEAVEKEVVEE